MKVEEKTLTFPKSLNVKYSGKVIKETETEITLEGEDEDSYFKLYSPFRGVEKLLVFENNSWLDSETSSPFAGMDLSSMGLDPSAFENMDFGKSDEEDAEEESESEAKTEDSVEDASYEVVEETPEETEKEEAKSETNEDKPLSQEKTVEALPVILIETERGDITCELFEDEAPNTVANMISLIEDGFYDTLKFHRVIDNFMVQGGCPDGNGMGGPGYRFADEFHEDRKHEGGGMLSMANSGPKTNGSQFFITHASQPHLDGKHTVFGQVTEGMDVVNAIEQGDVMRKVKVLSKRDHEYKVKKC